MVSHTASALLFLPPATATQGQANQILFPYAKILELFKFCQGLKADWRKEGRIDVQDHKCLNEHEPEEGRALKADFL
ncbi:hypothetical protein SLA2020_491560 [Shorea laevis]